MINPKEMQQIASTYQCQGYPLVTIGTLGSHSALDITKGAMDEGFRTTVICRKGREKTYEHHRFRKRGDDYVGCIGEVMVLDKWEDIVKEEKLQSLLKSNTILIPHRSMEVYLKYGIIEDQLTVPVLGNRKLLRAEERTGPYKSEKDQDYLVKEAGIPTPKKFSKPEEIDRKVIIKATAAIGERDFERRFPIVSTPEEYREKCKELMQRGLTSEEKLRIEANFLAAPIEEYVPGKKINLNFFQSVMHSDDPPYNGLELLGCDTRMQFPNGEELAHKAVSLRESLMEKAYDMGEKFVETTINIYPPGIIGPFALQTVADEKENLLVYDVSLRIPGSPDTEFTPYTGYFYGEPISFGRRIAKEIKEAILAKRLEEIVS